MKSTLQKYNFGKEKKFSGFDMMKEFVLILIAVGFFLVAWFSLTHA